MNKKIKIRTIIGARIIDTLVFLAFLAGILTTFALLSPNGGGSGAGLLGGLDAVVNVFTAAGILCVIIQSIYSIIQKRSLGDKLMKIAYKTSKGKPPHSIQIILLQLSKYSIFLICFTLAITVHNVYLNFLPSLLLIIMHTVPQKSSGLPVIYRILKITPVKLALGENKL